MNEYWKQLFNSVESFWLIDCFQHGEARDSGLNQGSRTTGGIREEGIHYKAIGDAGEVRA